MNNPEKWKPHRLAVAAAEKARKRAQTVAKVAYDKGGSFKAYERDMREADIAYLRTCARSAVAHQVFAGGYLDALRSLGATL